MVKSSQFKNEYDKKRYSLEFLRGTYIPRNLEECFKELDKLLSDERKAQIKSSAENQSALDRPFRAGLWMRNKWSLWKGSRLKMYFKTKGIDHPDEMSEIVSLFYLDWLLGIDENWKDWEQNPKRRIELVCKLNRLL